MRRVLFLRMPSGGSGSGGVTADQRPYPSLHMGLFCFMKNCDSQKLWTARVFPQPSTKGNQSFVCKSCATCRPVPECGMWGSVASMDLSFSPHRFSLRPEKKADVLPLCVPYCCSFEPCCGTGLRYRHLHARTSWYICSARSTRSWSFVVFLM